MTDLNTVYRKTTPLMCVREKHKTHTVSHICNTYDSVRLSGFMEQPPGLIRNYEEVSAADINDDDIVVRDAHDVNMTFHFGRNTHTLQHSTESCPLQVVHEDGDIKWEQTTHRGYRFGCPEVGDEEVVGRLLGGIRSHLQPRSDKVNQLPRPRLPSAFHTPSFRFW